MIFDHLRAQKYEHIHLSLPGSSEYLPAIVFILFQADYNFDKGAFVSYSVSPIIYRRENMLYLFLVLT